MYDATITYKQARPSNVRERMGVSKLEREK
jgi:hypothetical protein